MKPDSRAPAHRWAVLKLFPKTWLLQTKQNIKLEVLGQKRGGGEINKLFLKLGLLLQVDKTSGTILGQ